MVISCPRSFDKTRCGSQNYVLQWWVFPFVGLKIYVDVNVETVKSCPKTSEQISSL